MNKLIDPTEMSKVTQQFTQEHTKLTITDEMSTYKKFFDEFLFFFINENHHYFKLVKHLKQLWDKKVIQKKKMLLLIKFLMKSVFHLMKKYDLNDDEFYFDF